MTIFSFEFFNQLLRFGYVIRDKRKIMAANVINRFEEGLTFMVAFVSQASGFLPENKRNSFEGQSIVNDVNGVNIKIGSHWCFIYE